MDSKILPHVNGEWYLKTKVEYFHESTPNIVLILVNP